MRDAIIALIEEPPGRYTPAALSYRLRRGAGGVLGQDPAPTVAAEIMALAEAGELGRLEICPGCGLPGPLYVSPGHPEAEAEPERLPTGHETEDALAPLVAEGTIELSERVEYHETSCCARTTRAWRKAPRPS